MADFFYDGMPNVNERLNQLYTAFAAGQYAALPLTGGTLTGPLVSTARITADSVFASKQISAGVPSSGANSSVRAVNNGDPAVAGVFYEVGSYGVGGIDNSSSAGRFLWLTCGGFGSPLAAGYKMVLRAFDVSTFTVGGNLLEVSGQGNLGVTGTITGASIMPDRDNVRTIGSAGVAYATVYARTGAINTSDARLKCDFRNLSAAEIAAARELARAIGVYRWRDAVASKGAGAREHIGPTVQRAIEIMQAHGLDPFGYGFICHDAWAQQSIEHPAVAAVPARDDYPAVEARAAYTEVKLEAGDRYAFRYDELAMFIAAGQEARLSALEAR